VVAEFPTASPASRVRTVHARGAECSPPFPVNAISTQALSRGRACAEHALDVEDGITPEEEREVRAFEQYAENEAYVSKINRKRSIEEIEPNIQRLSLEDYTELCDLRRAWFKRASELKVSFLDGVVDVNVVFWSDTRFEDDSHAGESESVSLRDAVVDMWHMQDVEMWALDLENPTCKQDLSGPDAARWVEAFERELASLTEHGVYELVGRPQSCNVMKGKVVCKIRRDA
jgi:hypothetical protein